LPTKWGRVWLSSQILDFWHKNTMDKHLSQGILKGGSITVLLISCLTGLESAVWLLTVFVFYLQSRLIQTSQTGGQWWYFPLWYSSFYFSTLSVFKKICFIRFVTRLTHIPVQINVWRPIKGDPERDFKNQQEIAASFGL